MRQAHQKGSVVSKVNENNALAMGYYFTAFGAARGGME